MSGVGCPGTRYPYRQARTCLQLSVCRYSSNLLGSVIIVRHSFTNTSQIHLTIMKVAAFVPLLGAASAAVAPAQKPIGFNLPDFSDVLPADRAKPWLHPFEELKKALGGLTEDARKTWDEVALMFPASFKAENFVSKPKPHKRKGDQEWDHIVRGSDLQSVWVTNAKGEKERAIDGHLSPYSLRAKKVDPAALGVDKVKQYSGYLDDEEEDKHLFYCTSHAVERQSYDANFP